MDISFFQHPHCNISSFLSSDENEWNAENGLFFFPPSKWKKKSNQLEHDEPQMEKGSQWKLLLYKNESECFYVNITGESTIL